jgi:hypothetical protein
MLRASGVIETPRLQSSVRVQPRKSGLFVVGTFDLSRAFPANATFAFHRVACAASTDACRSFLRLEKKRA